MFSWNFLGSWSFLGSYYVHSDIYGLIIQPIIIYHYFLDIFRCLDAIRDFLEHQETGKKIPEIFRICSEYQESAFEGSLDCFCCCCFNVCDCIFPSLVVSLLWWVGSVGVASCNIYSLYNLICLQFAMDSWIQHIQHWLCCILDQVFRIYICWVCNSIPTQFYFNKSLAWHWVGFLDCILVVLNLPHCPAVLLGFPGSALVLWACSFWLLWNAFG